MAIPPAAWGGLMDDEIRLKQGVSAVSRYCHSSESRVRSQASEANIPEKSHRRTGLSDWQVKRVTDYVDARLEGPVRVDDLAAAAKLSPGHFRRVFSISFGMSPYAFVMQQRIERARTLLLASQHEMGDIAFACGLSDHAHFSRLFRRFVGTTPSQWRHELATQSASQDGIR
jgi:transcriptional regulator GlxA family with amidase domain